jgi:DDB1- and CUL4-associated factor 13
MFAAPFVSQLGHGHQDGVYQIASHPSSLTKFASASADGVVKTWDLTTRAETWQTRAHETNIKGLAWVKDQLLTCATDGVKLFAEQTDRKAAPAATWLGSFTSLSHHRARNVFAASGSDSTIKIFDLDRPAAPEVLQWSSASTDTITHVCFNQVEQSIIGATSVDRSIIFYDLRTSSPVSKVCSCRKGKNNRTCSTDATQTVLNFASNKIDWNPMEAFNFACANEDHNIYSTS